MLNDIIKALKEHYTIPVVYGAVTDKDVKATDRWNYIVIQRANATRDSSGMIYQNYEIAYVDEDYIVEGVDKELMDVMRTVKCRLDYEQNITHEYMTKANTTTVIEIMRMQFAAKTVDCDV